MGTGGKIRREARSSRAGAGLGEAGGTVGTSSGINARRGELGGAGTRTGAPPMWRLPAGQGLAGVVGFLHLRGVSAGLAPSVILSVMIVLPHINSMLGKV